MIREYLLSKILGHRVMFFKDEKGDFKLINEIEFSDDVLICYFKDRSDMND